MSVICKYPKASLKCTPASRCDAIDCANPTYLTFNRYAIVIVIAK